MQLFQIFCLLFPDMSYLVRAQFLYDIGKRNALQCRHKKIFACNLPFAEIKGQYFRHRYGCLLLNQTVTCNFNRHDILFVTQQRSAGDNPCFQHYVTSGRG